MRRPITPIARRRRIEAETAPPLPCCAVTDRGFRARAARGLGRRRPAPVAGAGSRWRGRGPIPSRTFVTPRNMKRRKPIACLLSACRRKTCGTRAGPKSAAGRRGRRRSAYEAPRAAADGGTRLGGAESKRRRRPRLPAPPSRVTLLIWNDLSNVLVTFPFLSLWSGAGGGRGGRIDG